MKRLFLFGIMIVLLAVIVGFSRTAFDPDAFTGKWYSAADQSVYLFQEGLIYNSKHSVPVSDKDALSGAYTCCKDSVYLFAKGIAGLETEKELFLVERNDGSFLCEREDGSGEIYFIRYKE